MGIIQFSDCYRKRSVLVTGHTGFKGSWLVHWLQTLGAQVVGIGLDPNTRPNHWDALGLEVEDHRLDIRDFETVHNILTISKPDIVFHLAAQPLVRQSYDDPLGNWSTNVMGTATVLEACRQCAGVRAIVAIATDKVYQNREWPWGYRENDPLGGHDPYSASKSACEVLIDSYRQSFFSASGAPLLASARAGNVIGGGDWADDRLIPDIVRAAAAGQSVEIRAPFSTRPWQHVLECLSGYLLLGEKLLAKERNFADAWNFGPAGEHTQTVESILALMQQRWKRITWQPSKAAHPQEATLLNLDSTKAHDQLGWSPVWKLEQAVSQTVDWYRSFYQNHSVLTAPQLEQYVQQAIANKCSWVSES
jgi:CDP-glucose 4,6-dehydratase